MMSVRSTAKVEGIKICSVSCLSNSVLLCKMKLFKNNCEPSNLLVTIDIPHSFSVIVSDKSYQRGHPGMEAYKGPSERKRKAMYDLDCTKVKIPRRGIH